MTGIDIRQEIQNLQKTSGFTKFVIVLLVVIVYFFSVVIKYGIVEGLSLTLLTWSFFVFCTPIADAGILLDFPIRVITNNPMQRTELFVFCTGAAIIGYNYLMNKSIFHTTYLTRLLKKIIENPLSMYGLIVIISIVGTLISATLENELYTYFIYKKINMKKDTFVEYVSLFVICWVVYVYILYKYHITLQNVY